MQHVAPLARRRRGQVDDGATNGMHGTLQAGGKSYDLSPRLARSTRTRFAPSSSTQLRVVHVLAEGHWATVEMRSMATAMNGMPFDNRYCWVVRFDAGRIVQVRAYLDSALIQRLFDDNDTGHALAHAGAEAS